MITVGNIKAEVLLKIEGMEGTYSVGHIEIPVNVTTDENRPGQINLRADFATGGIEWAGTTALVLSGLCFFLLREKPLLASGRED